MTFEQYERALKRLNDQALPEAISEAINNVAGFAHANQARVLRDKFTLRNRYTENSLRFYKATPKARIEKINAITGTFSQYLPAHESGGQHKPKVGSKVPMPTLAARGGRYSMVVRKRYWAGHLGTDQFIGKPKGSRSRPIGVYERYGRNKRLRLIRSLENSFIPIKPSHWHTLAMKPYSKREVFEEEFARQASRVLSALGAR